MQILFAFQILDWYRTVGTVYLQKSELGESYHQAQLLQEDQNRFESQAQVSGSLTHFID